MVYVLRLAPWRRGWRLLWRFPSVWWSLFSAGAIFALTVALPPLYLGSTASASFATQAAARCPWIAGMEARSLQSAPPGLPADSSAERIATDMLGPAAQAVYEADARRGHLGPAVTSLVVSATMAGRRGRDDEPTSLIYRDGGERNVHMTGRVAGEGLLLTDRVAAALAVRPGQKVSFLTLDGPLASARVVGTYRDLADEPVQPFWCSLDRSIHLQDAFSNNVPPPVVLATSPAVALAVAREVNPQAAIDVLAERPLGNGLRIDQGEQGLAVLKDVQARAAVITRDGPFGNFLHSELPFLVSRANAVQNALAPPIDALAAGAALAALGLVAIAGSFWAERRRTELDLLTVRGVSPFAISGKAAIEAAAPLLAGVIGGTALAVVAVLALGPAGAVTPGSVRTAALLAAPGWLVAGGVVAAAVRWRQRAPRPVARRRIGLVPLTLVDAGLLVVALAVLRRVSPLQTSSEANALPSFGLARLLLPLLVLLLVARLVARVGVALLGVLRGRGDAWRVPVLLAVQRLAAVPRVPAALAVTVAVACGTCLYATGLANSLHRTVDAKAQVFVGGLGSIELNGRQQLPSVAGIDATTPVLRLYRPRLGSPTGPEISVLAIDPRTFARGAAWDTGYADRSLSSLLKGISGSDPLSGVPAIAVGIDADDVTAVVDLNAPLAVDLHVVSRARAFPGLRQQPLLVVSAEALQRTYPTAVESSTEQLWTRRPLEPLVTHLRAAGLEVRSSVDIADVSAAPSLEAVLQTLRILRGLGLLVAVLAALGLIVYVDVRARQRRLASVLTRRMGLRVRADWAAAWLELGAAAGTGLLVGGVTGLGLVAYVSALLDPVPLVPPGPLVALPLTYAGALVLATFVLTAVSAAVSMRGSSSDAAVLRAV